MIRNQQFPDGYHESNLNEIVVEYRCACGRYNCNSVSENEAVIELVRHGETYGVRVETSCGNCPEAFAGTFFTSDLRETSYQDLKIFYFDVQPSQINVYPSFFEPADEMTVYYAFEP